jgi:SAM-dependent methyltransferase
VEFEDEAPTPAMPPVAASPVAAVAGGRDVDGAAAGDTERRSDPGAELSADDVVAEEPAAPPKAPGSLPPMRPHMKSHPSIPAPVNKKASGPIALPKPPLVIVPPHVGTIAPQPTEGSGLRRKGRLWWEDLFNDDYLRTCEKLTDEQIAREVDFIEDSLGIERGGALLDLACGTGRHAIELARRGYEVVGFDLSLAMLARAGDEAQDRDAKLNFVQGDMREMTFEEQFDGVYCWNTSFGYFEEDKNAVVIDRVHAALRSGGLFLLDVANRDFLVRQSPSLAWFEGDGCVCMDEMAVDFITSRLRVKRTMMLDDGRTREIEYSMRVYSLHELGKMLHQHGFKITEVSGRLATPGVFFGNESPRTLILAEKREKR